MAKKSVRAIFLKNNRAMITIVKASESWMPMSQNGDHQKRHEYTYAYIDRWGNFTYQQPLKKVRKKWEKTEQGPCLPYSFFSKSFGRAILTIPVCYLRTFLSGQRSIRGPEPWLSVFLNHDCVNFLSDATEDGEIRNNKKANAPAIGEETNTMYNDLKDTQKYILINLNRMKFENQVKKEG